MSESLLKNSLNNLSNNGHSENMKLQLGIKEHVLRPRDVSTTFIEIELPRPRYDG